MAKTIVLYYSATGTTKARAQKVAAALQADLAEIHAAKPYTAADLDWHDPQSRTSVEQYGHDSRVAIKDDLPGISGYSNVVIGHPIWWAIPPRLIAATIDRLDLNGKNLATFATSGGSTYANSQRNVARTVKENGYRVQVNQGAVLNSDVAQAAWLKQLNFN